MARSSPELPQSGPEEADSSNNLYTICMTKTIPDPFLALKIALVTYFVEPIFLEEVTCSLSFDITMPPCAQWRVLHQKTFFPNCSVLKYVYNRLLRIRFQKFEPASTKSFQSNFLLASRRSFFCRPWHLLQLNKRFLIWGKVPDSSVKSNAITEILVKEKEDGWHQKRVCNDESES